MTKDEILELALDWFKCYQDKSMSRNNAEELADEVIVAIKAALEAKVEPVIDESAAKRIATALGWEPKRKPLTDETRNWIVATCPTPRHIIDAVERMHGIKGEA